MPPPAPNEWHQLRAAIHREAQTALGVPGMRFTEIDAAVLRAAGDWHAQGRTVDWSWRSLARQPDYRVHISL